MVGLGARVETMARFPRLQNVLLLLITVLLLLNILLPTRHTVQLVKVVSEGGLEVVVTTGTPSALQQEQSSMPSMKPREQTGSRENTGPLTSTESAKKVVEDRAREPFWFRKDNEVDLRRRGRDEDFRWQGGAEVRVARVAKEALGERDESEHSRINFHDPAQRLAYYKKLRRRMMEGGPDARPIRERRMNRRLEMVHDMWDGWFEDDQKCKCDPLQATCTPKL